MGAEVGSLASLTLGAFSALGALAPFSSWKTCSTRREHQHLILGV